MNENRYIFYMPDEGEAHKRTWMAFVASNKIWSKRQIPQVKRDLCLIAHTIAKYEPVNMLVAPWDRAEAAAMIKSLGPASYPITLLEFVVDDLWLRDTGPTFVWNNRGEKVAVDFNFNGWGNKQKHTNDAKVAGFIADYSDSKYFQSDLVLEGGCFEVDGHGTAIMTKSCIVNDNRNPGVSFEEIDLHLKEVLGLNKIIWLEGVKGKDITDGHTDFYARFVMPGHVIASRDNYRQSHDYDVTRENIRILKQSTDAEGRPLKVDILDAPDEINEQFGVNQFAAGYIGYYLCNGAVIAQKFGDNRTDQEAFSLLSKLFPDRDVIQLVIDGIASGGGSVHCATQQEISS